MCQICVNKHLMTAEDLANALADGDTSVMSLQSLSPEEFHDQVKRLTRESIEQEVPFGEVVFEIALLIAIYQACRSEIPDEDADNLLMKLFTD